MAGVGLPVGRRNRSGLMNLVSGERHIPKYGAHLTSVSFARSTSGIGLGPAGAGAATPFVVPALGYSSATCFTLWAAVSLPTTSEMGIFVGIVEHGAADAGVHVGVGGTNTDNPGNNIIGLIGGLVFRFPGGGFVSIGTGVHTVALVRNAEYRFYIDGVDVGSDGDYGPNLSGNVVMQTMAQSTTYRGLSGGTVAHAATWNRALSANELAELHQRAMNGTMGHY